MFIEEPVLPENVDVMAKIAVIIFNFLETFMISWNIVNMMFLCAHCLNDDWQWRDDLETDKAKIKLGLKTTFLNLLCLICSSILHILQEDIDDDRQRTQTVSG